MKCQLCRYPFDNLRRTPLVLPLCGHTFCENCITENNDEKTFSCPLDDTAYDLRGHSKSFPVNNVLSDLIGQCDRMCKEHERPLEYLCLEEQTEICANCALFGQHQSHKLTQVKDFPAHFQDQVKIFEQKLSGLVFRRDYQSHETLLDLLQNQVRSKIKNVRKGIVSKLDDVKKKLKNQLFSHLEKIEFETLEHFSKVYQNKNSDFAQIRAMSSAIDGKLAKLVSKSTRNFKSVKKSLSSLSKVGFLIEDVETLHKKLEVHFQKASAFDVKMEVNFTHLKEVIVLKPNWKPSDDDSEILNEDITNPMLREEFPEESKVFSTPFALESPKDAKFSGKSFFPPGKNSSEFEYQLPERRRQNSEKLFEASNQTESSQTFYRPKSHKLVFRSLVNSFHDSRDTRAFSQKKSSTNTKSMLASNCSLEAVPERSFETLTFRASQLQPALMDSGISRLEIQVSDEIVDKNFLKSKIGLLASGSQGTSRIRFSSCVFLTDPMETLLECFPNRLDFTAFIDLSGNTFHTKPSKAFASLLLAKKVKVTF